jgi:hypothetical protein
MNDLLEVEDIVFRATEMHVDKVVVQGASGRTRCSQNLIDCPSHARTPVVVEVLKALLAPLLCV